MASSVSTAEQIRSQQVESLLPQLVNAVSTTTLSASQSRKAITFAHRHLARPDFPDSQEDKALQQAHTLSRSLTIRGNLQAAHLLEQHAHFLGKYTLRLLHVLLSCARAPLASAVTGCWHISPPAAAEEEKVYERDNEAERERARRLLADTLPSAADISSQFIYSDSSSNSEDEHDDGADAGSHASSPTTDAAIRRKRPAPQQVPLSWLVTDDPSTSTAHELADGEQTWLSTETFRQANKDEPSVPTASCLSSASHGFELAAQAEDIASSLRNCSSCAAANALGESAARHIRKHAAAAARSAGPTPIASEQAGIQLAYEIAPLVKLVKDVDGAAKAQREHGLQQDAAERTAAVLDVAYMHAKQERKVALNILLDACIPYVRSLVCLIGDGSVDNDPNGELCCADDSAAPEALKLRTGESNHPLIPVFLAPLHSHILSAARATRLLRRASAAVPSSPPELMPRLRFSAAEELCVERRILSSDDADLNPVDDQQYHGGTVQSSDMSSMVVPPNGAKDAFQNSVSSEIGLVKVDDRIGSWVDQAMTRSSSNVALCVEQMTTEEDESAASLTSLRAMPLIPESAMPLQHSPSLISSWFVKHCDALRKSTLLSDWPFETFYHQHSQLNRSIQKAETSLASTQQATFAAEPADHVLNTHILSPLRTWCKHIQARAVDCLLSQHNLMGELSKLRELFLGSNPDVISTLSEISSESNKLLEQSFIQQNDRQMRDVGASLLGKVGIDNSCVRARVGSAPAPKHEGSVRRTALCVYELTNVGWPLDTVLGTKHIPHGYSKAQAAIVELRQAVSELDRALLYNQSLAVHEAAHAARVCEQHMAFGMMDAWNRFERNVNAPVESLSALRGVHDELVREVTQRARELERSGALDVARLGACHARRLEHERRASTSDVSVETEREGVTVRETYATLCAVVRASYDLQCLRTHLLFTR